MGCSLKVSGENFKVDAFLRKSKFKPTIAMRRGDPVYVFGERIKNSVWGISGFDLKISKDWGTLESQVGAAIQFVRRNQKALRMLSRENTVLTSFEFSVRRDVTRKSLRAKYLSLGHIDKFPLKLIQLASKYGIELHLHTHHPRVQ